MMRHTARSAARPFIVPDRQPRLLLAALLVAALSAGSQGWAAEAEPEPPAGDAPAGTTKPSAEEDPKPGADVFIPSEDISEDFAVAFPVDI